MKDAVHAGKVVFPEINETVVVGKWSHLSTYCVHLRWDQHNSSTQKVVFVYYT